VLLVQVGALAHQLALVRKRTLLQTSAGRINSGWLVVSSEF
jgi:hypothetical protein